MQNVTTPVKIYGHVRGPQGPQRAHTLRFSPIDPGVFPNGPLATISTSIGVVTNAVGYFEVKLPMGVAFNVKVSAAPGVYSFTVPRSVDEINLVDLIAPKPHAVLWQVKSSTGTWQTIYADLDLSTLPETVELRLRSVMSDFSESAVKLSSVHWAFSAVFPITVDNVAHTLSFQRSDLSDGVALTTLELENPLAELGTLFPNWEEQSVFPWCPEQLTDIETYPVVTVRQAIPVPVPEYQQSAAYQPSSGIRTIRSAASHTLSGEEASAACLRLDFPYSGTVFLPEADALTLPVAPAQADFRTTKLTVLSETVLLFSSDTVVLSLDKDDLQAVEWVELQAGERYWLVWVWQDDLGSVGAPGLSGWVVVPQAFGQARLDELSERVDQVQTHLRMTGIPLTQPLLTLASGVYHVVDDASDLSEVVVPRLAPDEPIGWTATVINVSARPLSLAVSDPDTLNVPAGSLAALLPDGLAQFVHRGGGRWSISGDLVKVVTANSQITATTHVAATVLREYQRPVKTSGTYVLKEGILDVEIEPLWLDAAFSGGMATVRLLNHTATPIPCVFSGNVVVPAGKTPTIQAGGVVTAIFLSTPGQGTLTLSGDLA